MLVLQGCIPVQDKPQLQVKCTMYSSMAPVKLSCTEDVAGAVLTSVSKQLCNTAQFTYISKATVRVGKLLTFFNKYC